MKLLLGAILGATLLASSATAATLSIIGGAASTLPSNYNPQPNPTIAGTGPGMAITEFDITTIIGNGLYLNGPSKITFTYLGEEANANTAAFELVNGTKLLNNGRSALGDMIMAEMTAGFVNFSFVRQPGLASITNGVGGVDFTNPVSMAFHQESATSVLAFFGDGAGNNDHDDIVIRISAVPVPAGALLLLTAVGGLGVARSRKKAA